MGREKPQGPTFRERIVLEVGQPPMETEDCPGPGANSRALSDGQREPSSRPGLLIAPGFSEGHDSDID